MELIVPAVAVFATMSVAVILSLGCLFFAGVLSRRVEYIEKYIPVCLVVTVGFLMLANGILNERNLRLASLGAALIESNPSNIYLWVSRILNSLVIFTCVVCFISGIFKKSFAGHVNLSVPIIVLVFFGISSFLLPGFFGRIPNFDYRLLYPTVVMVAIFLTPASNIKLVLWSAKWCLFIFLLTSLLFIAVDANRVIALGYKGWIPGADFRFWGLASHANAIGPMAVLLLLLELLVGERYRIIKINMLAVAVTVLLLAQSKTSIGAALVGLSIVFFVKFGHIDARDKKNQLHAGHAALFIAILLVSGILLAASIFGALDPLINRLSAGEVGNSLETISGRDVIWSTAYQEFKNSPIFGYGPTIWDENYRRSVGLNFAYHAHNQILQSMAASGLIGLIGLVLFLSLSAMKCIGASRSTCGVSIAVLILFIARSITEVPLLASSIGSSEMFSMIILVAIWRLSVK